MWINPYIAQRSPLFEEAARKGYLLKRPDGGVWQTDQWQPGMGIVDFTNPAARSLVCQGHLRRLVGDGRRRFKTDFGERIPTDVVYSDGSDPEKMHNYYPVLYNEAVFELLEQERGKGEALVFARSATRRASASRSTGAATATRPSSRWRRACGAGFRSACPGSASGATTSAASRDTPPAPSTSGGSPSACCPRTAGCTAARSYRVPWIYDEEAVDVLRFFTKLKCRLMPYLYAKAVRGARRGVPSCAPCSLEFPDDPACDTLDRQYMLGDALLVAPVLTEDGTTTSSCRTACGRTS